MDKVTGVLFKMLGKTKLQEDRFHLEQIRQTWPELVGKVLAKHAYPSRLSRRRLTLFVDTSGWSSEFFINRLLILQKINEALGEEVLKDLILTNGKFAKSKTTVTKAAPLPEVELTPAEAKEALQACPVLEDPALAAKAKDFFLKQARREKQLRQQGASQCSRCGAFISKDEELCPVCKRELEEEARQKLARLLAQQPWLTETAARKITGCSTYLYISVKESLKAFYNLKVRQETATEAEQSLAVCLTYSRPRERITALDYENALKAIRGKKQHVFSTRK